MNKILKQKLNRDILFKFQMISYYINVDCDSTILRKTTIQILSYGNFYSTVFCSKLMQLLADIAIR